MEKQKYIQPDVLVILYEDTILGLRGVSVYDKNPEGRNLFFETTAIEGNMYEDARAQQSNLWEEDEEE